MANLICPAAQFRPKRKAHPKMRLISVNPALLGSKGELVDIDRVRFFVVVAVDLVINRDPVPVPAGGSVIAVERRSLPVQRDGFEQQMIIRGALHVDGQVVPGIADRIAGNAALYPVFARIVPSVPLMATSDPAFMTPNV